MEMQASSIGTQNKQPPHTVSNQIAAERAAKDAREAAERQFIGDILADDNSDYDQESHDEDPVVKNSLPSTAPAHSPKALPISANDD